MRPAALGAGAERTIRRARSRLGPLVLATALVAALALALPAGASAAEWTLTVNVAGEGHGEVECKIKEPGEEEYEEYCEGVGTHPNNTQIIVVPLAEEESSKFGGFENGTGSTTGCAKACSFKLTANSSVDARFDLKEFNLKVKTAGTGKGAVECEVDFGPVGPCATKYPYGTEVTLLAEAEEESELVAWSGACEYAEEEEGCELTIEEETTVTATFNLQPKLKVEKKGSGGGTVECEVEGFLGEPCEPRYPRGTELILVAEPEEGSEFVKWEGECDRIAGEECELEMNADRTVKALFAPIAHTLTIIKAGTGTGTVTCNGGPCASSYATGTEVTLVASAASGSTFAGWSAGAGSAAACSGTTASCTFEIEVDSSVTAAFNPAAKPDPPPAETCATNPALCLQPRPAEGTAKVAGSASVSGGKAALRLTCSVGACSGSLTLTAMVKQGKKTKNLVIGMASFSLPPGSTQTLAVKIANPQAKQLLAQGETLKAQLVGTGVQGRMVKLKPAKGKRGHGGGS